MIVFDRLSSLSEPIRVRILRVLSRAELAVGEIARVLQTPQPTVSRHLKQLDDTGWLAKRRAGTASYYRFAADDQDALWQAVCGAVDTEGAETVWGEDLRRLEGVLAARTGDSAELFRRLGGRWDDVRRELFGDRFVLPTLLALLPRGLTIADLGCGTGAMLPHLSPVAGTLIGVDRERAMLDVARERISGEVDLREGLLDALPILSGTVDVALCALVLHHVRELAPVCGEVARVLKPGGCWVILDMVEHDREDYRDTMGHQHLGFGEGALAALLSGAGLTLEQYRPLPADPDAGGPGVFVAVARR